MAICPGFGGEKTKPIKANSFATEGTEDTEGVFVLRYQILKGNLKKQSQFGGVLNGCKRFYGKGLCKNAPSLGAEKQSQSNPIAGFGRKLEAACKNSWIPAFAGMTAIKEHLVEHDLKKQSQFAKGPSELNRLYKQDLCDFSPPDTSKKQSQFKANFAADSKAPIRPGGTSCCKPFVLRLLGRGRLSCEVESQRTISIRAGYRRHAEPHACGGSQHRLRSVKNDLSKEKLHLT